MITSTTDSKSSWKRTLLEWTAIGSVALLLYVTGLHTQVIGTLQRAMLWTGLFDADTSKIATTEGPQLSNQDYDLILQTPDENQLSLRDFKGDVLFINIWASWCPPCIAEMPTIKTLHQAVDDHPNIKFILLSMDEDRQKAIDFMDERKFAMPYYFPAFRLPSKLQSQYLPTTYVIAKSGQVVYKQEGIADYSSLNFAQWMRDLAER
jgi:thiol-disulfide isomerase/thioredoxin